LFARRYNLSLGAGANFYLCFSTIMAGLDGGANKISPSPAMDKNLYDLPPAERLKVSTVCGSLQQAIDPLASDHDFLTLNAIFMSSGIEFIT
jgi:glutamine synthetase